MIDVKVEWNFTPDELEKLIVNQAVEHVTNQIATLSCPTHHQSPQVTFIANSGNEFTYSVSSCCDELDTLVRSMLN